MDLQQQLNISIVLDKRRQKDSNKYPIKLRVYYKPFKKAKLYPIGEDLTEKEFEHIWTNGKSNRLRGDNRETQIRLQKFENKAIDEIKKISSFSFELFEKKYFRKSSNSNDIIYHFKNKMESCIKHNKIGTSENLKYSLKSLSDYANYKVGKELKIIPFEIITPEWLNSYEEYMLNNEKSITSVGIYLRNLRTIFNKAIDDEDINKDLYPFGKKKYQIPITRKVKKALNNDALKILFNSNPKSIEQEKAKEFWFFSYACSGMNMKDIALLKYSDIKDDQFTYYRAKTFSKSVVKKSIVIHLNEFTKSIIEKHGSNDIGSFVFPILNKTDNEDQKYKKVKNFTRFVNQHLKKLAIELGLTEEISSYWARHSFATNSIRKGASKEFISEALNHSDMKVTENYFAGFEDEVKKEFANKLMDF